MQQPSTIFGAACRNVLVTLATMLGLIISAGSMANAAGDPTRGETLYQGCQDCHSIEKNDVGPMHKGVIGRTSGAVQGYNYSPALKKARIVWTEENLDKWLADPQQLVPGTKMFYEVKSPQDRADLIAFLREHAR